LHLPPFANSWLLGSPRDIFYISGLHLIVQRSRPLHTCTSSKGPL
jgi:hypothetical protein